MSLEIRAFIYKEVYATCSCVSFFLVACSARFVRFRRVFDPYEWHFLGRNLKVLRCSDRVENGVYGKLTLSYFQWDWPYAILTSVQETAASGSRVVWLIFVFRMVFPNFPVRILVNSKMLFANRENHVVEEVSLYEKVLAFQKLMVRIGKILRAKVVWRIAVVGNFPTLWLVLVVFLASGWPSSLC